MAPIVLYHRPQVLSWDAPSTCAQQRLIPYRAEIAERFADRGGDPLSFKLDGGLGPTSNLEAAGDLDNLLIPVLDALGPRRFVAAWGSKNAGTQSQLAVGPPVVVDESSFAGWHRVAVRTSTAAGTVAWKMEVAAQVQAAEPLPPTGAAALIIAFTVGPTRAWRNLWKPAIDALGHILGPGPREWHPRDGRIIELGLCVAVDPARKWTVDPDVRSQPRPW